MTEDEWKSAPDGGPLIEWLHGQRLIGRRKATLFYAALLRADWHAPPPHVAGLLGEVERLVDLHPGLRETRERRDLIRHDLELAALAGGDQPAYNSLRWLTHVTGLAPTPEAAARPDLVRELFGNPFRKVRCVSERLRDRVLRLPAERRTNDLLFVNEWRMWQGGLIPKLAEGIVADRAYDRMPVLGDAMEEAGCHDAEVLEHCRVGGPHAPGCWVLDLILGKE